MACFHLFSSKYHCMFTRRSSQGHCTFLPLCQGQLEVITSHLYLISKEWDTCLLLAFPFPDFQTECHLCIWKHWFLEPLENESFSWMLYLLLPCKWLGSTRLQGPARDPTPPEGGAESGKWSPNPDTGQPPAASLHDVCLYVCVCVCVCVCHSVMSHSLQTHGL